jgi:chitinase
VGDRIAEPDETFRIKLSNAVGASIQDRTGRATIDDDDTGPSISIGDASVSEGQQAAFLVTLSAPVVSPVTVDYATADGSATAPADYQPTSGTLTFEPGQTVSQIVVHVAGDTVSEIRETYALNLPNATGATISDGVGVGTINDDDTPSMAVANATVTEGNAGTVNAVFNVTLSFASSQTVTVAYATADGSATAPADYQATSGTLTLDPGETAGQILVPVAGDTAIEVAETFSLNLTTAVNATFADATAQGTIADNDTVSISIGSATVTETNAGIRDAVFTVTLSAVSGNTVSVDYATADGSATASADYIAGNGTLTFAPGEISKQIVVQVVGDVLVEANETYSVNLSNPLNATIAGSGYGLGTITNND